MKSGTLRDYSEDMYKVYFEIGEFEREGLNTLTSFVGDFHSKHILHLEFGYELAIPIQCIPEVVRLLSQKNIAIYQIVRGEKIEETWR
ncbi:MAG: hypothetical protein QS748_14540 [Candidatus Endonucleobacter bathymodioli]|uniref:Uncharacterized protein n=1 Tax=Candidatus Endonucleibacter bathymodioli TaxID=539814 RepID=A0AA90NWJ3_9GAMM|nr:hypothetical protein [Candidatus Endonucleobacter bathymodioli]